MVDHLDVSRRRRSPALVGGRQQFCVEFKGSNFRGERCVVAKALDSSRGKVVRHEGTHLDHKLVKRVQDSIWAGIVRVGNPGFARPLVIGVGNSHNLPGDVVHVKDGRVGVGADRVELVGIPHGQLSKGGKILGQKSGFDGLHSVGNNRRNSVGKERRGSNAGAHSGCGGGVLLGVAHDHNDGTDFRPVGFIGNLDGHGIAPWSIVITTSLGGSRPPSDESSIQGSAGRSAALPGESCELSFIGFLGVH
mmetsp:Transcript_9726/g.20155  ORF Transcript_9726/g.20155 Transcript_9726/m.20155 type:complete len:249 (+) Transcript_9726:210-956(+)